MDIRFALHDLARVDGPGVAVAKTDEVIEPLDTVRDELARTEIPDRE